MKISPLPDMNLTELPAERRFPQAKRTLDSPGKLGEPVREGEKSSSLTCPLTHLPHCRFAVTGAVKGWGMRSGAKNKSFLHNYSYARNEPRMISTNPIKVRRKD